MPRHLHKLYRPAHMDNGYPPLVFVHGAYINSECWNINFLPFFQKHGYNCYAFDLSGHGKSPGRENLNSFGLDDYAANLAQIVAKLDAEPVLIGHSMGALVVQRYLEKASAKGLVMLAPVPPTGLIAATVQMGIKQPDFFTEAAHALNGQYSANTVRMMREVYFSPDASTEQFSVFPPMLQNESMRALTEMMALAMRLPAAHPRIPALVIGGELDALFAANRLHFAAAGWNAETCIIPRAGHMLMLDPQWQNVAEKIANWLCSKVNKS